MTPLQVIMLGKRMRDAQRRLDTFTDDFASGMDAAEELERAFDDAIAPYVDYVKAVEVQDGK